MEQSLSARDRALLVGALEALWARVDEQVAWSLVEENTSGALWIDDFEGSEECQRLASIICEKIDDWKTALCKEGEEAHS